MDFSKAIKKNQCLLFSYGTLQLKSVQVETYGRQLTGYKDSLSGYRLGKLEITDPDVLRMSQKKHHPIAIKTNEPEDIVSGVLFELTEEELKETDHYEVSDYQRVLETFDSGKKAWIYIGKKGSE